MSPEMDYRMFQTGENEGGAILPAERPGQFHGLPRHRRHRRRRSRKCASTAARPEEKTPVPGHGWMAACKDTEGNAFSLWQGDSSAGS